jgi:Fe-S cluster assembly scaffold protein SufB
MIALFVGSCDAFQLQFPTIEIPHHTYDMVYVLSDNNIPSDVWELPCTHAHQSTLVVIQQGVTIALKHIIDELHAYERCDIVLEEQSRLYLYVDCKNNELFSKTNITFYLARNSYVSCVSMYMSTKNYSLEINYAFNMQGAHAQALLYAFYGMKGAQNFAINTRQHHYAPHAESLVVLKGVVADTSHLAYNGIISIDEDAHYTNAEQQNKNMLWGNQARAIAIPSLEVKAHQVQCKHGSATGYFNEMHVFYMQSRGIDTRVVQQLLLKGFFQDSIAKADVELWHGYLSVAIDEYIDGIIHNI